MATSESIKGRARFAAACGVLSRYVKEAAMETEAWPVVATPVALPLMPGADMSTTTHEEPGTPGASAQMTIFYGGRLVVLDDVPADRAAELLRLAAAGGVGAATTTQQGRTHRGVQAPRHGQAAVDDVPMARKASLQRFMEKRRCRVAARAAPYSRPDDGCDACPDDSLTLKL